MKRVELHTDAGQCDMRRIQSSQGNAVGREKRRCSRIIVHLSVFYFKTLKGIGGFMQVYQSVTQRCFCQRCAERETVKRHLQSERHILQVDVLQDYFPVGGIGFGGVGSCGVIQAKRQVGVFEQYFVHYGCFGVECHTVAGYKQFTKSSPQLHPINQVIGIDGGPFEGDTIYFHLLFQQWQQLDIYLKALYAEQRIVVLGRRFHIIHHQVERKR